MNIKSHLKICVIMFKIEETGYSPGSGVMGYDTLADANELEMENVVELYQFFNSVVAAEKVDRESRIFLRFQVENSTHN